jgi:hypothetical protein
MAVFRAPALRAQAPDTMNIEATLVDYMPDRRHHKKSRLEYASKNVRSMNMLQH